MDGIKKNGGIKHPIFPLRRNVIALHFNFIACVHSIEVNRLMVRGYASLLRARQVKRKGGAHMANKKL